MMAWRCVRNPNDDFVHIIPIGDFEPHDESEDCRCEPYRKPVDGGARDLLIHRPYDDSLLDGDKIKDSLHSAG
jgi:hypothetical protein